MKYKEEIFAGSLLFLSSFFPHFEISLLLIYAYASYFRLKYFSPFISALLIPFSPIHALLSILPYPFLFLDRKAGISYYVSLAFSLFTQNYILMLFLSFLDRKGLLSAGISLLVVTAFLQGNYIVTFGNTAFMLILAGIISSLIEGRISQKTSIVAVSSAVLVYFHLYFLLPALLIFSPWVSLLFAYFNPYLGLIALAELKRKLKYADIIPSFFSFLYPPLSLTLIRKTPSYFLLIPLASAIYLFLTFNYTLLNQIEYLILLVLVTRYFPYFRVARILKDYYVYMTSVMLVFLGVYFYFLNLPFFTLFMLTALAISFPLKAEIKGLPIAVLSLANPVYGLGLASKRYSGVFLLIPLIAFIFFHYPLYSYFFSLAGVIISLFLTSREFREKWILLILSVLYLTYSLYLIVIGEIIITEFYLPISLFFVILFNLMKNEDKINVRDMISFLALSYPFPFLSPLFIYIGKKVNPYVALLLEGVIILFLIKVEYLSYIIISLPI
ncbi:hypothetical protein [Sulfurisphaera javensis]|uniref:hypothetical protein n=1 Tax=Sulfurisphaera javensis TaxID=2049879 RepID=UPI0034E8F4D4